MKRLLTVAIALMLFCSVAVASEVGDTIDWVWNQVFYLAGIIIAGLITKWLSKLAKKLGVEISDKQRAQLEDILDQGIHYANEKARKKFKVDKFITKSEDKFADACKYIGEKVPYLTEEQVRKYVVARLPEARGWGDETIAEMVAKAKELAEGKKK